MAHQSWLSHVGGQSGWPILVITCRGSKWLTNLSYHMSEVKVAHQSRLSHVRGKSGSLISVITCRGSKWLTKPQWSCAGGQSGSLYSTPRKPYRESPFFLISSVNIIYCHTEISEWKVLVSYTVPTVRVNLYVLFLKQTAPWVFSIGGTCSTTAKGKWSQFSQIQTVKA